MSYFDWVELFESNDCFIGKEFIEFGTVDGGFGRKIKYFKYFFGLIVKIWLKFVTHAISVNNT